MSGNLCQLRLKLNQPIRLGIDLDGVIFDFNKRMIEEFSKRGFHFESLREMFMAIEKDENLVKINKEIYRQAGFYKDLPIIEGAVEAYHELDKMVDVDGNKLFKLYIVSAPSRHNPTCASDKYADILKWFGRDAVERTILTYDKTLADIHVLVDDRLNVSGENGSTKFPRSTQKGLISNERNDMSFEHIRFYTDMYEYNNKPNFPLIKNWLVDPTEESYKDIIVSKCIDMNLLESCEMECQS